LVDQVLEFTTVVLKYHNVKDKHHKEQAEQVLLEVEEEVVQDVLEW